MELKLEPRDGYLLATIKGRLTTLKAAAVHFDSSAAEFEHVSIVGQRLAGRFY